MELLENAWRDPEEGLEEHKKEFEKIEIEARKRYNQRTKRYI